MIPRAGFGLKKMGTSSCQGRVCSALTPSWVGWRVRWLGAIKLGKILVEKKISTGHRKNVRSLSQLESCPGGAQIHLEHRKAGEGGKKAGEHQGVQNTQGVACCPTATWRGTLSPGSSPRVPARLGGGML